MRVVGEYETQEFVDNMLPEDYEFYKNVINMSKEDYEFYKPVGDAVLLPVNEGVLHVDMWIPEEQDLIFRSCGKIIIVPFNELYKRDTIDSFNRFYISYKEAYYKKLRLITHYINYFIKFYDPDKELISIYMNLKYIVDLKKTTINRNAFIKLLMKYMFTPTMIKKLPKMSIDNYRVDLTACKITILNHWNSPMNMPGL